jgi:hypothetical protein
MDRRRLPLAVGILLLAAAYALPLPDVPVGNEATELLAAASLWHEGDLRFEPRDLARAHAIWREGPTGLALVADAPGGGWVFARPILYPLLAAPVYGFLGPRGLRVLNLALFLAMLWLARRHLVSGPAPGHPATSSRQPWRPRPRQVGLLLGGFFFASGAAVWVLRLQSEVLLMACLFVALALWCRVRCEPAWGRRELLPLAAAGMLIAAAAVSEPALALLAVPVAVDLAWARRLKGAAIFAGALLAAALLLVGVQQRWTGSWGPALAAQATVFEGPFPYEVGVPGDAAPEEVEAAASEAPARPSLALLARRAGWLLAGRHVGALAYFPFGLFVSGLYLLDLRTRGGRHRHLLAAALFVYWVVAVVRFPEAAFPGAAAAAAPGARALALVYPLLLLLPRRLRAGRSAGLPALAAGLWLAPALAVAASGLAAGYGVELPARGPTYRVLPLELELLAKNELPGYATFDRFPEATGGRWLVPAETFFISEGHPGGVWVRGGTRSEIYVVSQGAVGTVRFRAKSIAAENTLRVQGAAATLRARFDTAGKRQGVPVEIHPKLVARGLGLFPTDRPEDERIYRFTLETTGGAIPARVDPQSNDPRYLGVFLEF